MVVDCNPFKRLPGTMPPGAVMMPWSRVWWGHSDGERPPGWGDKKQYTGVH